MRTRWSTRTTRAAMVLVPTLGAAAAQPAAIMTTPARAATTPAA